MARLRTLSAGILNIKTHPHDHANYRLLFSKIFEYGQLVKLRGSDWATTNFCKITDKDTTEECLYGEFYRFLEIDPLGTWLDVRNKKQIVSLDGEPVPQVENYKKPNSKTIEFTFYPHGHRMFFNLNSVTPNLAQAMMLSLFSDERIVKEFGIVDVEIESSSEAIERILKIPTLTMLDIYISRPNGDVISGKKRKLLKRMEDQGIRKLEEKLTSLKTEGIKPDDSTIAMMELAISNGKIFASGYVGDEKVDESTDPHPLIEKDKYDPDKMSSLFALKNFTSSIVGRIIQRG